MVTGVSDPRADLKMRVSNRTNSMQFHCCQILFCIPERRWFISGQQCFVSDSWSVIPMAMLTSQTAKRHNVRCIQEAMPSIHANPPVLYVYLSPPRREKSRFERQSAARYAGRWVQIDCSRRRSSRYLLSAFSFGWSRRLRMAGWRSREMASSWNDLARRRRGKHNPRGPRG